MRKVLMLILLGVVAALAAATTSVQGESHSTTLTPPVTWSGIQTPKQGEGAGYYYWDSNETGPWAPAYNWRTPNGPKGWRGDDTYWTVTTPFDMRFCNTTYEAGITFYVGSNGILGFAAAGMSDPINQNLPNSAVPNAIMAILWDNLHGYSDGDIWVEVVGSAPNRKWCISYSPWYYFEAPADPIEFQVYIYEAPMSGVNNTIEFRYKDVVGDSWRDNGFSATVGLENATGSDAVQYSYNQPVLTSQLAIRYVDTNWVDDQVGEFNLLTPPDGAVVNPGDTVNFTWEKPDYDGHGVVNFTLYLADNPDFNDPLVFDLGENNYFSYIFGTAETGTYWWKVKAKESHLGITVWCNDNFSFTVSAIAVEETSWGQIKAEF